MSARLKTALLVTGVLIAAVAAIILKTGSLLYEERLSFIADSSMKQIAPLKRLVSEQLTERKKDLVHFAATRAVHGAGRSRGFGEFEVIALVEPDANGQWNPSWIERGAEASLDRWPQGYDLTLLKSIAYKKTKDGEVFWMRLSDARGTAMFAAAIPVQLKAAAISADPSEARALPDSTAEAVNVGAGARRGVVVGFTSTNPLVSSTEDFIGSTNAVYIVDERGYVASHVDKNYNGALFSEDNVVKEILSSQRLSGTGQFEDFDGRSVIGHFEKISDSNLFAVITTPMTLLTGVLDAYKRAAMFAALAIGLLGLIAAWIVGGTMSSSAPFVFKAVETESDEFADTNRDDEENPWIRAEASDISNKEFIEPENFAASMKTHKPEIRPEIRPDVKAGAKKESLLSGFNEERLKAERQTAFETVQKDFASRLREPLLAILGQAQLIQVKAKDDSIASHAGSIQREARLAKDALEKISSFDFNQTADSAIETTNEIADLEEVVSGALAAKALELQNLGVRIETYTDALSARGVTGELETALVHVIENSIEAMRDRDQKTLTISLRGSGEKAVLRISDTGIGMTQDTLSHAFEPFFRGFDSPRHMGLGLSFVQSTIRKAGGECTIESSIGEGTTIEMKFPLVETDEVSFHALAAEESVLGGRRPLKEEEIPMLPPLPVAADQEEEAEEFAVYIRKPRPKGS